MKLFKTYSEKQARKIEKIADKVLALETSTAELSDSELRAKTSEFKKQIEHGASLDELLPEAFAVCREADWRVLNMKPYKVQVMGGIILHQGRIAEMRTGEGKTLVATLPAYLNALTGKGVHIITVNDYLAKRDSEQMGKVFRFLGLTVGLVTSEIAPELKKPMYAADITYGTNNEFGFDYLRDNMAVEKNAVVQRGHNFVIVDEVDSVLIDEARTPLIISGQAGAVSKMYAAADQLAKIFTAEKVKEFDRSEDQEHPDADYLIDEKGKNVVLTTRGIQRAERFFGIENFSDPENAVVAHHVLQAVKANGIMKRDIDYVIKDGEVVIVDEFTGCLMDGRRYNDGLHQAIEAKEGVKVASESKTFATITFQNFFRLYAKLSGMTGTALTEEDEFRQIYKLDVVAVPTNKPVIRKDRTDLVYGTKEAKTNAIIRQIRKCYNKGQPIIVGTVSVEKSEELSARLRKENIPHQVLNAKNHEQEAKIIAQAGHSYSVTIATNMAGRGTDIVLGGNPEYMAIEKLKQLGIPEDVISESIGFAEISDENILEVRAQYHNYCDEFKVQTQKDAEVVKRAGGLYVLGTERHESRRIDNQLRGRAGRQGDPGESRFFLSLEDPLLRLFLPDGAVKNFVGAGMEDDEPIDSKMLAGAIETAQKRLEGRNFHIRKNVLQYDDVMNQQRQQIYKVRNDILNGCEIEHSVNEMANFFLKTVLDNVCVNQAVFTEELALTLNGLVKNSLIAEEDLALGNSQMKEFIGKNLPDVKIGLLKYLRQCASERISRKREIVGEQKLGELERIVFLKTIDQFWMSHIDSMSLLKDGIGLQAYGQHDPVVEYKRAAHEMYEQMIKDIRMNTIFNIYRTKIFIPDSIEGAA